MLPVRGYTYAISTTTAYYMVIYIRVCTCLPCRGSVSHLNKLLQNTCTTEYKTRRSGRI